MKKRSFLHISLAIALMLLATFTVYAAFSMINSYGVKGNYHEIDENNLVFTPEPANVNVKFTKPGEKITFTYGLENKAPNTEPYSYYFMIDSDNTTAYNPLFDMIYVYQNDNMLGVLSEFITYTKENNIHLGTNLSLTRLIKVGLKHDNIFTLELHNAANEYMASLNGAPLSINLKLKCIINTINYQTNLFVKNEEELIKAIDDVNALKIDDTNLAKEKTIILADNITLTKPVAIKNTCTIDLLGSRLTLNGKLTVANSEYAQMVTIKDSSTGGMIDSGTIANLELNGAMSIIKPELSIRGASIVAYDLAKLKALLLEEQFDKLITTDSYELIGYYGAYVGKASTNLYVDGVASPSLYTRAASDSDKVINVELKNNNEVLYNAAYTVVGNNVDMLNTLKTSYLAHLTPLTDPKALTRHDLFLPTAIKEKGITLSWRSSNAKIMADDGRIVDQGVVTMTATIKIYDKVYLISYKLNVAKQNNQDKLKYLASKVETKLILEAISTGDKTPVGSFYELPVAGEINKDNSKYYTNWTIDEAGNPVDLGITNLRYELDANYYYIGLTENTHPAPDDKYLTDANVYLKNHTYEKNARIKIIGEFGSESTYTFINVSINLLESEIEDQIYADIQKYLDGIDVLKLMLETRKTDLTKESGDFILPKELHGVSLSYKVGSTDPQADKYDKLYEIGTDSAGNPMVKFKDYTEFKLTDTIIPITADINVAAGHTEVDARTLYFKIPGAITDKNFTTKLTAENTITPLAINLFTTIKYQTLMQIDDTLKVSGTRLMDLVSADSIKSLPKYILIHDALQTENLVFEVGNETVIIDTYDLNILKTILGWAIDPNGAKSLNDYANSETGNTLDITKYVSNDLLWIQSDGTANLSDAEIAFILDYCEKIPGAAYIFSKQIFIGDNTLSKEDINKLKGTIATDTTFVKILDWITSGSKETLYNYLLFSGLTNEEVTTKVNEYYRNKVSIPFADGEVAKLNTVKKVNNKLANIKKEITNEANARFDATPDVYIKQLIRSELTKEETNGKTEAQITELVEQKFSALTPEQKTAYKSKFVASVLTYNNFPDEKATSQAKKDFIRKYLTDKKDNEITFDAKRTMYLEDTANISNNGTKVNLPAFIYDLSNDGLFTVSNEEERAIIYYVQKNHTSKYDEFYTKWLEVIKRQDNVNGVPADPNRVDIKVKTNEIIKLTGDYKGPCYDFILRGLLNWALESNSNSDTPAQHFHTDALALLNINGTDYKDYTSVYLEGFLGSKKQIFGKNEWVVINAYLDKYYSNVVCPEYDALKGIIGNGKILEINTANPGVREYLTVVEVNVVFGAGKEYGYILNAAGIKALKDKSNAIYLQNNQLNPSINSYNLLWDWAISETAPNSWDKIPGVTPELISGVPSGLINDLKATISFDEYLVLSKYYRNFSNIWLQNQPNNPDLVKLNDFYKNYYWTGFDDANNNALKLGFVNNSINDDQRSAISNVISPSEGLNAIFDKINMLYRGSTPVTNDYWDNLDTVSAKEVEYLANLINGNPSIDTAKKTEFISMLNQVITTYNVILEGGTYVAKPKDTIDGKATDRSIVINDIIDEINRKVNPNNLSYKFIPISQINTPEEIETIAIIRHFKNLSSLIFRGRKAEDLFSTSGIADMTFLMVTAATPNLKTLAFEYSKLTSIKGIENLTALESLSLKGNRSTNKTETYLKDLSPILSLLDKKTGKALSHLNVSNIDTVLSDTDLILNKIYSKCKTAGVTPDIYYTKNNKETLFTPASEAPEYLELLELASLLHEIDVVTGNLILLPSKIYGPNSTIGLISWFIADGSQYASISGNSVTINKHEDGKSIVLAAKVTKQGSASNLSVTRYFIVRIPVINL